MKKILHIENLDCPVCAEALQADLQKIKGVQSVCVDYVTQTISLDVEEELAIARVVKKANAFEKVRVLDGGMYAIKAELRWKEWGVIILSTLLLVLAVCFDSLFFNDAWKVVAYCVYAAAYVLVGHPVFISTVKNVAKGRVFDENFLMTVASIGAIAIGEMGEGVLVMLLYQLGELLQSIAVGSSRRSVTELLRLKSETATVVKDGEQKSVVPEELAVGDMIVVKAGERVPVDCVLLAESAVMDTKSLTGESGLRSFQSGEEILSGCINAGGMVEMKVLRVYKDSAVGKILDMVENAASGKAAPEKFITKFARIYTPMVCCFALALVIFAPLFSAWLADGYFYFKDFSRWLRSGLSFLVISCPCALIISVPLTYFSGIGKCAKSGILVKGATYLDVLARVKTLALDKTGTLTEGDFSICGVHSVGAEEEFLQWVIAAERGSSHPIAKAFAGLQSDFVATDVTEIAGCGLSAKVNGAHILVGNEKLMAQFGVVFEQFDSVYTVLYVVKDGCYCGAVEVGDRLRAEAKESISMMRKLGISRVVMLTGDRAARAEKVAKEAGVYEVKSELLPMDKVGAAEELQKEGSLLYVGDGINDAPVMASSNCAVSMGKLGSAAAVEASDVVLISDNLSVLPKAIKIARKTRSVVMQNIVFSIAMKVGFMTLSLFGVLPLWLAVFADVGVMLLAVLNSFRVRFAHSRAYDIR